MYLFYMFYTYNFIFQRLIWRMSSVCLFVMVLLLKSQRTKNCKSAESFCLSILTTQVIGSLKFWHIYCCHVYFFSARFLNMCKARTTFYLLWRDGPPGLGFYGSGPACLRSWQEMLNVGRLGSMRSEIFLKMKFSRVAPLSRLLFYLRKLLHIFSSLFSFACYLCYLA